MNEADLWQGYRNLPVKEKGKLREPAEAIAAAKCILFRLGFEGKEMGMHPDPCRMCKVELGRLVPIYEEWMQWSGLKDPENKEARTETLCPECGILLAARTQKLKPAATD